MVDILDEVKDEIEQEKIQNFWKENGTFIVVSVILVISIVGGRAFWADYKVERDAERTAALMQSFEGQTLSAHAAEAEGTHAVVANLLAGGDQTQTTEQRIAYYERIAGNDDFEPVYRDLATLTLVGLKAEGEGADMAALIEQLEPLTDDDRPYRASALELQSFLYASNGEYDQAIARVDQILEADDELSAALSGRMQTLKAYYETQKGA